MPLSLGIECKGCPELALREDGRSCDNKGTPRCLKQQKRATAK